MALTPSSSASNGGNRGTSLPGGPVRVLVVDDSMFMRRAISEMIASEPGLEVVDQAKDGQEAVEKAKKLLPDVITLDVEMPVLNGLEALKRIRREARRPNGGGPPAVLMCSSLTTEGSHEALQALRLGAADIIAKDASQFSTSIKEMRDDLVQKVREIALAARRRAAMPTGTPVPASKGTDEEPTPSLAGTQFDLLVIGSSTGGPPVLETLFAAMPAGLSMPVVVAQHMPVLFTKSMSQRLDAQAAITVVHGENGMPLLPGTAYILPGGLHGRVIKSSLGGGRLALEIGPEPTSAVFKPSVNELFNSAAKATGRRTLGVMLTGMGDDGKFGARAIKAAGGRLLAQNAATCVVYGMPKAVIEEGLGTPLTPEQIAKALATLGGAGNGARTKAA